MEGDAPDYIRCGARLSQGDIVRAPVSIVARARDLSSPPTDALTLRYEPLPLGDPAGLTIPAPGLQVGIKQAFLRVWYQPAVVVSPDCGIEKQTQPILVAPLLPASAYAQNELDGIRADTALAAFLLPPAAQLVYPDGTRSAWPECVVNLARMTAMTQGLIIPERFTALGPSQLDRLQERLIRFFALNELSSTGTVEAMTGRTIRTVRVLESSRRRHTVELTLDDGRLFVLYQEPRRNGPHLEVVVLRNGRFSRATIYATPSTDLVLRFENEDSSDHHIECRRVDLHPANLPTASTTEVTVHCPDEPCHVVIRDLDSDEILTIQVTESGASRLS